MIETQEQKCERCNADGLRDDEDCPYYGEPNGCNSPTYGRYPPMETNDMAKMREALESILSILKGFDFDNQNAPTPDDLNCVHGAIGIADAALSAPPRNCDRLGGDIDLLREACLRERGLNPEEDFPKVFCEWLLEIAEVRHA